MHDGRYAIPNSTAKAKDKPKEYKLEKRVFLDKNEKPINEEAKREEPLPLLQVQEEQPRQPAEQANLIPQQPAGNDIDTLGKDQPEQIPQAAPKKDLRPLPLQLVEEEEEKVLNDQNMGVDDHNVRARQSWRDGFEDTPGNEDQ